MSPLYSYISPSPLTPPSLFSLRCRASCLEYASHCSLSIISCIFRSPYFWFHLGLGGGRAANPAWAPRILNSSPTSLLHFYRSLFLSQFILPTPTRNTNWTCPRHRAFGLSSHPFRYRLLRTHPASHKEYRTPTTTRYVYSAVNPAPVPYRQDGNTNLPDGLQPVYCHLAFLRSKAMPQSSFDGA